MSAQEESTSPPPYNPYAPPVVETVRPEPRKKKSRPDRVARGIVALFVLLNVVAFGMDATVLGGLASRNGTLVRVGGMAVGLIWLHRRWSSMSEEAQRVLAGRRIGPTAAVLFHFMPILQFFWAFKVQTALRDGVNGVVRPRASAKRAPRDPAILAPLVQLCVSLTIGLLDRSWFFLVAIGATSIAWTTHMITIERAWAWRRRDFRTPRPEEAARSPEEDA